MNSPTHKVHRLDPLTLSHLHRVVESADPVADLADRIEGLRAEMDRAPAWKHGTPWYTDRERELASMTTQMARLAPGHPVLLANVVAIAPTGPAHVGPTRGQILPLHLRDPLAREESEGENQEPKL